MESDPVPSIRRSTVLARRESFLLVGAGDRIGVVCVFERPVEFEMRCSRTGAYYELLTDAIVSGQTYPKIAPDPRLKALPNPWSGGQGIAAGP